MGIAVFVNPHSRANRKDPGLAGRFSEILGEAGQVFVPRSLEDLAAQAHAVAAQSPSILAIHGGDGTLHKTLSAIIPAWDGRPLPPVALLTGGTMNVVAASLGVAARPETLLAQLAEDARAGRAPQTVPRRCLRIGTRFGFIFGNGLMSNFLEEYYAKKGYGPPRAIWILLRTFLSIFVAGAYARKIFRRFSGRVTVDGKVLPWQTLTGVGAATVREVGLGFKLNHRADDDVDRMGALAIHAGALALLPDMWAVHRGRGVAPARAWSGVAETMLIEPGANSTGYTIDGDVYTAGGPIDIGMGPMLNFVKPRR